MALPKAFGRPRSGVNRMTRWHSPAAPVVPDPILLASCVADFPYNAGVFGSDQVTPTINGGDVYYWRNRADSHLATAVDGGSGRPTLSTTLGVSNKFGTYLSLFATITLSGAFTLYWLGNHDGGVHSSVIGAVAPDATGFQMTNTGSQIVNSTGATFVTADDGLGSGNALYRWRRKADNTCFYKVGGNAEQAMGSFTPNLGLTALFTALDEYMDAGDPTKRITLYTADLVTTGEATAVETAINAT